MRGFCIEYAWRRFLLSSPVVGRSRKLLCTGTNKSNKVAGEPAPSIRDLDAYRQLDKLDFMTAAKILFTTPPKKKKFGLDFHLVQLFFACMPSLAVYLVAQYARYEIRRMEAEAEVKKKQEEEEKAKEIEAKALEELEAAKSNPELLKVKVRLEALEEAVKEIVVETKKQSSGSSMKDKENTKTENIEQSKSESKSVDRNSASEKIDAARRPGSATDASTPFRSNEGKQLQGGGSQDLKK